MNERKSQTAKFKQPESFEEAVSRLEKIVARMESGEEDMDTMLASFEEGRALAEFCDKKLSAIERKVEILSKKADGSISAEPFSEEE